MIVPAEHFSQVIVAMLRCKQRTLKAGFQTKRPRRGGWDPKQAVGDAGENFTSTLMYNSRSILLVCSAHFKSLGPIAKECWGHCSLRLLGNVVTCKKTAHEHTSIVYESI